MDLKNSLQKKADDLAEKAKNLPSIEIKWENPIILNCDQMDASIVPDFKNNKDNPSIYFFKITNKISSEKVVKTLKEYKATKKHACPKIDDRSLDSIYLYCGSIKKDLHKRLKEHLGFGSETTYALHLKHWTEGLGLTLEFNYAWLDKKYIDYTELVESALAMELKPLVGKLA